MHVFHMFFYLRKILMSVIKGEQGGEGKTFIAVLVIGETIDNYG